VNALRLISCTGKEVQRVLYSFAAAASMLQRRTEKRPSSWISVAGDR